MPACLYVCMYVHLYVCVYVYMYVCVSCNYLINLNGKSALARKCYLYICDYFVSNYFYCNRCVKYHSQVVQSTIHTKLF